MARRDRNPRVDDAIDPRWIELTSAVARETFGHVLSEAELAGAVSMVSEVYTEKRATMPTLRAEERALEARLRFFLIRDLVKSAGPLAELLARGVLPERRNWRVLDVGAGLGTTTLGVAAFAARTGSADALDVVAFDHDDKALAIFKKLATHTRAEATPAVPIELRAEKRDLEKGLGLEAAARFDLILVGLTLNELFRGRSEEDAILARLRMLGDLAAHLTEGGALIVLEPALRETSRALHALRDRVVLEHPGALHVFAPCVHGEPCPMLADPRDWCHELLPTILPEATANVARRANLRWEGASYSYLTLRKAAGNVAPPGDGVHWARAVSSAAVTKGKVTFEACGGAKLVDYELWDRDRKSLPVLPHAIVRGDLLGTAARPTERRARIIDLSHESPFRKAHEA